MLRIVSSDAEPQYLQMLREWILAEWGKVDPFAGNHPDFKVPVPLLAVSGKKLVGGLAFTSYPVPGENHLGLWINTVIVAPGHRHTGIGTLLIRAAALEATRTCQRELFVYTNIPSIYQRLGWSTLGSVDGNHTLRMVVAET